MTAARALDGVRVIELVDQPVDYCGRILAGLGADVILAEPPEGGFRRHQGPFAAGRDGDPEASLVQWHFDVGKRSMVADDDAELARLIASSDVVVHTLSPRRPRPAASTTPAWPRATPGWCRAPSPRSA